MNDDEFLLSIFPSSLTHLFHFLIFMVAIGGPVVATLSRGLQQLIIFGQRTEVGGGWGELRREN